MLRAFLRAKIHRAIVTDANTHYIGSITLDAKLMKSADLLPMEQVDVLNVSNGNRLTTYCIEGKAGSGEVCLNGAAALLCAKGDIVLICAYAHLQPAEITEFKARTIFVNKKNRVIKVKETALALTGKPGPKR
jgi:aspartate 1-decarboxylase